MQELGALTLSTVEDLCITYSQFSVSLAPPYSWFLCICSFSISTVPHLQI